jgi:hypothetical protein
MSPSQPPMSAGDEQPPTADQRAGVATGLRFLAAVRRDPELRARLSSLELDAGLEPVLRFAAEAGYPLSSDDLRAAFLFDWGLRRARYLREDAPAASAATTVAVVHKPLSGT